MVIFFTTLHDKRDNFNFAIITFPHLDSIMPTAPEYGVYISQLRRYTRACRLYQRFDNFTVF